MNAHVLSLSNAIEILLPSSVFRSLQTVWHLNVKVYVHVYEIHTHTHPSSMYTYVFVYWHHLLVKFFFIFVSLFVLRIFLLCPARLFKDFPTLTAV